MDRETIIKLAREAGFSTGKRSDHIYGFDRDGDYTEELEDFAKLVAEHSASVEREACAQVCEQQDNRVVRRHPARIEFDPNSIMARKCAAAIRARGNT
jgi:hypothetical protein